MFGGVAFLCSGRMCCGVAGPDLVVRVVETEMPRALSPSSRSSDGSDGAPTARVRIRVPERLPHQ